MVGYPLGMKHVDVVIMGGGAAGLMCAISAGKRGRSVLVLESSNKIGKKILMSGGGRCNFTNLHTEPSRFIGANPHFCKSALSRYTQWDFISLVEKHGIEYHEKTLGQLFCDNSSKDILSMLVSECDDAGVKLVTECTDSVISAASAYEVKCRRGEFSCDSLVIATGGLSIPKMGASDFGYRTARQFDVPVLETTAGLVPFTLTGDIHEICNRLAGVSCRATVVAGNTAFTEDILFTHRGLSGPAMLQASSYWTPGQGIVVNLLPDVDIADTLFLAKRSRPKSLLRVVLAELLPKALVVELQGLFWPAQQDIPLNEMSDGHLRQIAASLQCWSIKPAATEGYRTAEVTLGGIDTNELASRTMECKRYPGLYFIGEVVDVTGHLGGFNFQWAWASGHAAGQVA
jgi:predicted Rossmann fold flavoprotein